MSYLVSERDRGGLELNAGDFAQLSAQEYSHQLRVIPETVLFQSR
jgi:hypothetical protein